MEENTQNTFDFDTAVEAAKAAHPELPAALFDTMIPVVVFNLSIS